jgi:hypothetical protein
VIMTLRKTSLGFGATILALVGASAMDTASAGFVYDGYVFDRGGFSSYAQTLRAPQPSQSLSGATSRPSGNRMRAVPDAGRRRGMGGMGRMNGGMGRR